MYLFIYFQSQHYLYSWQLKKVTAHCAYSQNKSKPSSRLVRHYCNRRRATGCLFLMEQDKLQPRQGDSSRLVCLSVHCVSESFLAIWFLCDKKADSTSHTDNCDANSQRADLHLMASAAKKLSINTTKVGWVLCMSYEFSTLEIIVTNPRDEKKLFDQRPGTPTLNTYEKSR